MEITITTLTREKRTLLNYGFIRLVDVMGSDRSIELAARQSYDENPAVRSEKDTRNLLRYLMRNHHTSPFEMAELVFQVKAPIFVFRQWHRHRTASINEISGRYSELPEEFYIPDKYNLQAKDNKQGSAEDTLPPLESAKWRSSVNDSGHDSFSTYRRLLDLGVSKEQARIHLPLSTFSTMTWKCNLHNLFHFLKLRLDSHAQYEIRVYAQEIAEIVKQLFPISWEAFVDYRLEAVTFSRMEMVILREMFSQKSVTSDRDFGLSDREKKDFLAKLSI